MEEPLLQGVPTGSPARTTSRQARDAHDPGQLACLTLERAKPTAGQ